MRLPGGTITFLFTDIEGSTCLWEEHPDAMRRALARHNDLVECAIVDAGGYEFKRVGDAFCAAFVARLAARPIGPTDSQEGRPVVDQATSLVSVSSAIRSSVPLTIAGVVFS
jgi:class 3 adenylate cyclase